MERLDGQDDNQNDEVGWTFVGNVLLSDPRTGLTNNGMHKPTFP